MNLFESSELFGFFLAIVAITITIVLLKQFYNQGWSNKIEGPIYGLHYTLVFRFKRRIARILLKLGKREETPEHVVDKLQIFSDQDEMPVDAVYFNLSAEDGQILLFSAARRKHGLFNVLGALRIPEYSDKLLLLPIFPKTSLYQTADEQTNLDCYSVSGLKIKSIKPNKEYRVEYKGKMVLDSSFRKEVDVELSAVYRSNLPTFNFSTNISKLAMSEAMALEPWSRDYFETLKSHHQTHFEQFGNAEGVAKIDGKEYSLKCSGLRDRTFCAKRDWNDFEHYIFYFIQLSNGNAISVGVISMPVLFRRLVAGFVTNAKDNINIPIDSCSIDLNSFNKQSPPDSFEFDFVANNDSYRVHVDCHTQTKYYMGERMESSIIEKWCNFKVNGVKGWGLWESAYRNEKHTSKI